MEVCGVDPSTRGKRTNECLEVLNHLLQGEKYSHHSHFFDFDDAQILPAPSPQIPIVIGGRSNAALKRTATYADGWLGVWCSPRRFTEATAEVSELALAAGRDKQEWTHGMQVWVGFGDDKARAREILAKEMQHFYHLPFEAFEKYSPYGCPEEVAEFLIPYVEKGASILNIKPCAVDDETEIEKVAEVCRLIKQETG